MPRSAIKAVKHFPGPESRGDRPVKHFTGAVDLPCRAETDRSVLENPRGCSWSNLPPGSIIGGHGCSVILLKLTCRPVLVYNLLKMPP